MKKDKPKLQTQELIESLERRGVRFIVMSKEQAFEYLEKHNNYFKLTSYRKNYRKNKEGKYVNLDFAYLKDLAIIDMRFRYCMLEMCLDIEHFAKVRLMKAITDCPNEDGYQVVSDFFLSHDEVEGEIRYNAYTSIYTSALYNKHKNSMAVWTLLELMSFGRFCKFFRFVACRMGDEQMKNEYYLLMAIKHLRNAAAHSNCIINDLTVQSDYPIDREVRAGLSKAKIAATTLDRRLKQAKVQHITTLLYLHQKWIKGGVHKHQAQHLGRVVSYRMFEHQGYYQKNTELLGFFCFMKKIVDLWFPNEYSNTVVKKQ